MKELTVRLHMTQYERMRIIAKEEDVSMAKIVRSLIDRWLYDWEGRKLKGGE